MDSTHDRRTVFVQGVDFKLAEDQFEEAFSEIGPVRKCFLLRRKDEKIHRGAGFVQYALPSDAERAAREFDGKLLLGRRVQVSCARKRATLAERKELKRGLSDLKSTIGEIGTLEPEPKRTKPTQKLLPGQKAACTLALGNLSPANTELALALARAAGEVESVKLDVPEAHVESAKLREDGCHGSVALVTYTSVKAALGAVSKLHGVYLTNKAHQQKGRRKICSDETEQLWARQLKGEGAMVKKWRVILRNLPFKVTSEELKKLLASAGFVWQLKMPQRSDGSSQGFAFASFTSRADAEKSIKLITGKSIHGRLIAVDWAVSKATFKGGEGVLKGQFAKELDEHSSPSILSDIAKGEQADDIACDESQMATEKILLRRVAQNLASEGSDKESEPPKLRRLHSQASQRECRTASEAVEQQTHLARGSITRTVFVRGLPSDVSEQQLRARLESFGPVKSCRLVMNSATNLPKGTAFIEFDSDLAAASAAQASEQERSGNGPGVSLAGRLLGVHLALTQESARAMASQKAGNAVSKDKRNLYLAKEGAIEEGSTAWNNLSRGDQEGRMRANLEKATKLRSPNFFVSTTRLSLRNLPFAIDEKALKRLLVDAVKEHAAKAVPTIKQVKILRDANKRDRNGNPTSMGIAFAEFLQHEHAMCALRQLNNNPGPFGTERRPIVEFALENAQTIKKRMLRETMKKGCKHVSPKSFQVRHPTTLEAEQTSTHVAEGPIGKGLVKRQGMTRVVPNASKRLGVPSKEATDQPKRRTMSKPEEQFREGKRIPKAADRKNFSDSSAGKGTDRLDHLILKYKASLFGSDGGASSRKGERLSKRWYD